MDAITAGARAFVLPSANNPRIGGVQFVDVPLKAIARSPALQPDVGFIIDDPGGSVPGGPIGTD